MALDFLAVGPGRSLNAACVFCLRDEAGDLLTPRGGPVKVAAETGRSSVQPTPWFQPGLALCSGWAKLSPESPWEGPQPGPFFRSGQNSVPGGLGHRRPCSCTGYWPEAVYRSYRVGLSSMAARLIKTCMSRTSWSGKTPRAAEHLNPRASTTEPKL